MVDEDEDELVARSLVPVYPREALRLTLMIQLL